MIPLAGRALRVPVEAPSRAVWTLVTGDAAAEPHHAALNPTAATAGDFGLYVAHATRPVPVRSDRTLTLPPDLDHLRTGDVIAVSPDWSRVRVLWRAASRHNSILLTERCDNYCLMCSQPP